MQTMNAEAHTPARTATARGGNLRRRGISSVLAMMYLMIFSTLALGFYATTTTASQVSHNERTTLAAHMAAESGTHFLRYHLSALDVRAGLTPERMFEEVYMQLASRLDGTANLDGSAVGYDGTTITIPQVGYINLDREGNQRFRVSLSRAGDLLVARVVGRGSNRSPGSTFVPTSSDGTGRGIEIKFQKANNATAIFNYGVASKGTVYTSGTSTITGLTDPMKGSILSTNMTAEVPVSIMGRKVSGDISTVNPAATVTFGSGASIGGTSNSALIRAHHIHLGVEMPRFPDIDTTVYAQYVERTYAPGMTVLDNVRIPAGTGTPAAPLRLDSVSVRGVLYIEGSNVIEFTGSSNIQAVIAVANNVPLNTTTNLISFTGSVSAQPVATLPASFGDVRKLQGAFILAPGYRVRVWGSFGQVSGSIICSQFQMGGSAEGTLQGSVIQTHDLPLTIDGSADVVVASVGTTEYPAGVTFGLHYTSVPGSYMEVEVGGSE